MSVTEILYKDISPGAAEDAELSASGQASFSDPSLLVDGVTTEPISTLELNGWGLNGTFEPMETQQVGVWSAAVSGADCTFPEDDVPSITVVFDEQYSMTGLTLVFDESTQEYCSKIRVIWYQDSTVLSDKEFEPTTVTYFAKQRVEAYNKIEIRLLRTSLPKHYAKISKIMFGVFRTFGMAEIRSAQITNEMDGITEQLPVSKFKWTLDSLENVDFMFQLKQPVEVRNDNRLIGVYYIDSSSRSARTMYSIDCYDALGVLDESTFAGGVYADKSASALLGEIIDGDFELDVQADDVNLTGIIEPCTKRAAMQQVLFAWMVCASTDGTNKIRVFELGTTAKTIGKDKTFAGASVKTDSIVTSVSVTAHSYAQAADGDIEIGGVKYADKQQVFTVTNPNVTLTDKKKTVEVTNATLVSPAIGHDVAQRVYDYYMQRNTNKSDFVWTGERLGDLLTQPTPWDGQTTGRLLKMSIKLSNTVVVGSETKGA